MSKEQQADARQLLCAADEIESTMTAADLRGLDAVFVVGDPLTFRYQNVPTFVPTPEYVEGMVLMANGPSLLDGPRRAAVYVDKIVRGAKAAELPVEQPRSTAWLSTFGWQEHSASVSRRRS